MRAIAILAFTWTTSVSLVGAWSQLSMNVDGQSRRAFVTGAISSAVVGALSLRQIDPAVAATPEIFKTPNGIKYAVTREQDSKNAVTPREGDIVAIEYTGYLTDGEIFDATHAEGKKNALLFKLGSTAVIPGINELLQEMVVGQKVQAIIPPSLAFGDKGLCIDDGECLIKPGTTLVYDVFLKKSSIPPP